MATVRVALREPVPAGYGPEIERRLYFLMPGIVGFRLHEQDGRIEAVVIDSDRPLPAAALADRLGYVLDNDVLRQGPPRSRRLVSWGETPATATGMFDALVEQGAVVPVGPGRMALAEPLIGLLECLDASLCAVVAGLFPTLAEYRYPTLLSTETLQRCGYFGSFPQQLMFVARLHTDVETYRDFLAGYADQGRLPEDLLARCDGTELCLPPTMCFHTFAQYQGTELPPGGSRIVTARGGSFRFESRYATGLERLWDFTIREFVFLGSPEFARGARDALLQAVVGLVQGWGLSGRCETANDPFFVGTDTAAKIWSQRLMEVKYELRLPTGPERDLAAGSFNVHDTFFGQSFDIRRGSEWASTSCAGFGLERLVYAFVCQHSTDPRGWPGPVREAVRAHRRPAATHREERLT